MAEMTESPVIETEHLALVGDARSIPEVADESVQLVVTSPPYPMIEMWDGVFTQLDSEIGEALSSGRAGEAFERMHAELDRCWSECFRVLSPGGLLCVNIGDATRTIDGDFQLWSNHARILSAATALGFSALPDVIWRKPTNAPNKFMGSGMLPAGAYVTYEHEYVLILRKGGKRIFAKEHEKANRRRSAFFWEERNVWFSDVWFDLLGTRQAIVDSDTRERSASFPFELAYRLIQMYSVYGDRVLDPFLGAGTTMLAAAASGRNSVGVEIDGAMLSGLGRAMEEVVDVAGDRIDARITAHEEFVRERRAAGKELKHVSERYGVPVMTKQEVELELLSPLSIARMGERSFEVTHGAPVRA